MCREMENMRKAGRIEIAQHMLASGKLTYEDIATFTNLTLFFLLIRSYCDLSGSSSSWGPFKFGIIHLIKVGYSN